jgi:hypothetical protein
MRIRYTAARVACEATYFVPGHWPTVLTGSATSITANSAVLNGTVNPLGQTTTFHFKYGQTTPLYSYTTTSNDAGSGSSNVAVNAAINELRPNSLYHYRLSADNSLAQDLTFRTATISPNAQTNEARNITSSTATLYGTVNPNNDNTTYRFEFGGTTNYGLFTSIASAGSGNSGVSVLALLSGITPLTTFHYRVIATNSAGSTNGDDKTFKTSDGSSVGPGGGGGGGGCYISTTAYEFWFNPNNGIPRQNNLGFMTRMALQSIKGTNRFAREVNGFPLFLFILLFGFAGWQWKKRIFIPLKKNL